MATSRDVDKQIVNAIYELSRRQMDVPVSVDDIAKKTGWDDDIIRRQLRGLIQSGVVQVETCSLAFDDAKPFIDEDPSPQDG